MSIPSQRPRRKFRKRNSKYAENCLWHRTMMDAVFRRTWQLTDGRRRQNLENSPEVWWSATLHKRELFLNHKLCRTAQHEQSLKKAISSREKTIFSYDILKPHVAVWQTQMAMHKGCAFPTASYAPYLLPIAHTRPIQPREGGGGELSKLRLLSTCGISWAAAPLQKSIQPNVWSSGIIPLRNRCWKVLQSYRECFMQWFKNML